jgi:hypothetical protein
MSRPFIFKFNAAELFAQIQPLNVEEKAAFIDQLSIDLLTLKARTEYAQQLIDETIKLIDTKRENGKKGGRPKNLKKARVKLKKPEVNSSLSYKDKDKDKDKDKKPYTENVFLAESEHETLVKKYGEEFTMKCIEKLSGYKLSNGKEYKSDYGAINYWVVDEIKKTFKTPEQPKPELVRGTPEYKAALQKKLAL